MPTPLLASRLTAALLLAAATPVLWACPDPTHHPELARYYTMIESWGKQPKLPVEMRFKLSEEAPRVGRPLEVELFYWPFGPYSDGRIAITSSEGLEMVDHPGSAALPYKGSHRVTVRPLKSGHHYLQVEHRLVVDGQTLRQLTAIPVPVETGHAATAPGTPPDFGFAGPRLKGIVGVADKTPTEDEL